MFFLSDHSQDPSLFLWCANCRSRVPGKILLDLKKLSFFLRTNGIGSMSFGLLNIPDALMNDAINYATRNGVVCVASVGNDEKTTLMYPAAFGNVIGVACVNTQDQPSALTNSGADMVAVAAPGENLVTTYPGDHYASVSGTSFSAALVSGAADVLMYQASSVKHAGLSQFVEPDVARALRHSNSCVTDGSLGAGCFDMNQATTSIQSMIVPRFRHYPRRRFHHFIGI